MDQSTSGDHGISKPHHHDVLYGRGNNINSNPGNKFFRELVKAVRVSYVAATKQKKPLYAKLVVHTIRNLDPPGRFLQRNDGDSLYYDVGDKRAVDKARQALREGAPDVEKKLDDGTAKAKDVTVEVLFAEEASRLYEEQFGTCIRKNNTDQVPHAEHDTAVTPKSSMTIPASESFLPEIIPAETFLPATTVERNDRFRHSSMPLPSRPAMVSITRRSVDSAFQAQFEPNCYEGEEPFLPSSSENKMDFDDNSRRVNMKRRPALTPMVSDQSLPGGTNFCHMPVGEGNDFLAPSRQGSLAFQATFNNCFNNFEDRRVSFKETAVDPLRSEGDRTHADLTGWEGKNQEYLAQFESQCKKGGRRRSSVMVNNYRKILDLIGNGDGEDEDDDEFIEARLHQIAGNLGNSRQINIDRNSVGAMEGLTTSMRTSLTLNEIFDDVPQKSSIRSSFNRSSFNRSSFNRSSFNRSSRMSLCSRKSARMSLILRQSCLDSFASIGSGCDETVEKHRIPDVFDSARNRRDSIITPSTTDLLSTVFGDEAAKIAADTPGSESALLRGALEPVMPDELMTEIAGPEDSFGDSFTEAMNASEKNINQFVEASIRDERRRMMNQFQYNSIGSACCDTAEGENPEEEKGESSDLPTSFYSSSMDLSMNSSFEKLIRNEFQ